MKLLLVTIPASEGLYAADDIELLQSTPGILSPSDRGNGSTQVRDQHHLIGPGTLLRAYFDFKLWRAKCDPQRNAVARRGHRPVDGATIVSDVIISTVHQQLRCI